MSASTTTRVATATAPLTLAPVRPARSLASDAWRQFRRHRPALAGVATLTVIILVPLAGPLVYGTPPTAMDVAHALEGPSLAHPLGTDDLGRDLLARAIVGGRVSVAVGLMA